MDLYSVCACMDIDGSGDCWNDSTEPKGRYPDPINIQTFGEVTDIDIELVDPIPCPGKTAAVPTLTYAGILVLVLAMIGSAVWFIRGRNSTS